MRGGGRPRSGEGSGPPARDGGVRREAPWWRAPAGVVLALVVALLAVACSPGKAGFRKGPWLLCPGDPARMEILWQADATPRVSRVEWGTTGTVAHDSGSLAEEDPGPEGHLFRYVVTGLVPGRWYRYRVTVDGTSREGSFRAAPAASARRVTFYALGDTRSRPDLLNDLLSTLLRDIDREPSARQTFCLHAGDWVSRPTEVAWDAEFFDPRAPALLAFEARVPLAGCRGNHEGDGRLLRKYWPMGYEDATGCWYSFDYGPVHVTVVDDQEEVGPGSPQYRWVERDLAGTDRPWRIVLHHEPAWSAGPHRDNLRVREALVPLFRRYGVLVVIAGHNHYYARCAADGITFLTLGGGGAPLATPDTARPHVLSACSAYHFVRFDVDGDTLRGTVLVPGGDVLDRFTLSLPAARGREDPLPAAAR